MKINSIQNIYSQYYKSSHSVNKDRTYNNKENFHTGEKIINGDILCVSFKSKDEYGKLSPCQKEVCNRLKNLKNMWGNNIVPNEVIDKFIHQANFTQESAKIIINRNLIQKELINLSDMLWISNLSDENFEKIRKIGPISYKILEYAPDLYYEYLDGKIDSNQLYENFSDMYFNEVFRNFPDKYRNNLKTRVNNNGIDSSNIDMLITLVSGGILSSRLLILDENGKLNKEAEKDLEKLYIAYINKDNIEKVFCPEYKTEKEAINSLKIGDVCQIEGENNISIKTNEDSLEKMFISPKKYLELFPPVEKYAFAQGNAGHCYIISSIDIVFKNPETRNKIIKMFKEEKDGTTSVCLDGFSYNHELKDVIPNGKTVIKNIEDITNEDNFYSYTTKALRAIEKCYCQEIENSAELYIDKQQKKLEQALVNIGNKKYINVDGFEYSKEELEIMHKAFEDSKLNPDDKSKKIISLKHLAGKFAYTYTDNKKGINDETDSSDNLTELINKRYKKYMKKNRINSVLMSDILPFSVAKKILGNRMYENEIYTGAGKSFVVLNRIGYKTIPFSTHKTTPDKIINENKDKIIGFVTATGQKNNNRINISPFHAYSTTPLINNKKNYDYLVRNPINSADEVKMNAEEFMDSFEEFNVAFKGRKNEMSDYGLSPNKQKIYEKLLTLKDESGNMVISAEKELENIKNEKMLTEDVAKIILDRGMIDKNYKNIKSLIILSMLEDKKWEEIKNYNYSDISNEIPLLFVLYNAGLKSLNELLDIYSMTVFARDFPNASVELFEKVNGSDVTASNLEMLINLIKDGELSQDIVQYLTDKGKFRDEISSDIDKLYLAKIENKDVNNIFVKGYENEKEAREKASIGEVFTLKGEKNIRIKLEDNSLKEIFLSPKKYMELFAPVERYAYTQGEIGVCFILSALDAIYSNKSTRYKILQMFRENADSTVSIAIKGFKRRGDKIIPCEENAFVVDDIQNKMEEKKNELSNTAEAIRCLQKFFELDATNSAKKHIKEQYNIIKRAYCEIGDKEYINIDGFEYSKDELKLALIYYEEYFKNPQDISSTMISMKDSYSNILLHLNNIKDNESEYIETDELDEQEEFKETNETDKQEEDNTLDYNDIEKYNLLYYLYLMWLRYKHKYPDKEAVNIAEVIPVKIIDFLDGIERKNHYNYIEMGSSDKVFKKFGFENAQNFYLDDEEVKNMLLNQDLSNYLITIGTKPDVGKNHYNLINNHYYTLICNDKNGKREFIIRNPYNSAWDIKIMFNDLIKYFKIISIAKINDK